MPDDITQKHLDRLRIRGAPATVPESPPWWRVSLSAGHALRGPGAEQAARAALTYEKVSRRSAELREAQKTTGASPSRANHPRVMDDPMEVVPTSDASR